MTYCNATLNTQEEQRQNKTMQNYSLCQYSHDQASYNDNVGFDAFDMSFYTHQIVCDAKEALEMLEQQGCEQNEAKRLRKAIRYAKRRNIWNQIESIYAKITTLLHAEKQARKVKTSDGVKSSNTENKQTKEKKKTKCGGITIKYVLDDNDAEMVRTALQLMLMNNDTAKGLFYFRNINKLSFRQFVCPKIDVEILIYEIKKYHKLVRTLDCLQVYKVTNNEEMQETQEQKIATTTKSLSFLQEYIRFLDFCLGCLKDKLDCFFVDAKYNEEARRVCKTITKTSRQGQRHAEARYTKYYEHQQKLFDAYNITVRGVPAEEIQNDTQQYKKTVTLYFAAY